MKAPLFILFVLALSSCIPESTKKQFKDQVAQLQTSLADHEFRNAIALIEVHKLREGSYPASLNEIKYLNMMDSATLKNVRYTKLDSGYELDLVMTGVSLDGKNQEIGLKYPTEFWKGLGCVKSNTK